MNRRGPLLALALALLLTACATSPTGRKQVGGSAFLSMHPSDAQRQERLAAMAPKMMAYYQAKGTRPTHPVRMGPAAM